MPIFKKKILLKRSSITSRPKFKQKWVKFKGKKIFARSGWEANVARYLEWLKSSTIILDWLHEPQTFWFEGIKRGCVSYLPDFKVINIDGSHYWIEVKGRMDSKSRTKIKRFKKYYPNEPIRVLDSKWYYANRDKLKALIPGWE